MPRRISRTLAAIIYVVVQASACAEFDRTMKSLGSPKPGRLTEAKIADGLKEALRVGTGNAVNRSGRPDGYYRNQAIKILMPQQLQAFEKSLRLVGFGPQLDEFILSMNRAAERAAPQARHIFLSAIGEMTFADAKKILSDGDTAATDYFKGKTTARLTTAFRPEVEQAMNEVGVTRQYKDLVGRFQAIPFAKSEAFDLDQYVVSKSLEGLFLVLGEEERKIRSDPAARATALLREVFAQ